MKNTVSKVVLTALVGCLSGVAQQNIPCPSYQTDVTRLDLSNGQNRSVWQVRLCLDDQESPFELSAARIRRNVAPAGQRDGPRDVERLRQLNPNVIYISPDRQVEATLDFLDILSRQQEASSLDRG